MKNYKILIFPAISAIILFFVGYSQVLAQTGLTPTPTGSTVPTPTITPKSDFVGDIQEGEKDTANDMDAHENQKDTKDMENVDAGEVNQAGVQELEPKENIENDENQENANNVDDTEKGQQDDASKSATKNSHKTPSSIKDNGNQSGQPENKDEGQKQ